MHMDLTSSGPLPYGSLDISTQTQSPLRFRLALSIRVLTVVAAASASASASSAVTVTSSDAVTSPAVMLPHPDKKNASASRIPDTIFAYFFVELLLVIVIPP